MTASAISQLVYLLDEAFQGTEWHSLLGNLHSVTPQDWLWVPPGGQRSIRNSDIDLAVTLVVARGISYQASL